MSRIALCFLWAFLIGAWAGVVTANVITQAESESGEVAGQSCVP